MKNEKLLKKLNVIKKDIFDDRGDEFMKLNKLIDEVEKSIKENSIIRVIYEGTQKGKILKFLQSDSSISVNAIYFNQKGLLQKQPFIGYSANSRLAELYKAGLVEKCGTVELKGGAEVQNYTITTKGLNFKIRKGK